MTTSVFAHSTDSMFRLTTRAAAELSSRDRRLSSRLRQLLVLIESHDNASSRLRDSLMTTENLDYLLRLELIEPVTATAHDAVVGLDPSPEIVPVARSVEPQETIFVSMAMPTVDIDQAPVMPQTPPIVAQQMSLHEIQALMVTSLRQSCGLLAAGLGREIESAQEISAVRRCQARWKMTLLESRYPRAQLIEWVETVSYHLSVLES